MITQFWLNDPSILFKNKHILELWPTSAMSKEEKLNAMFQLVQNHAQENLSAPVRVVQQPTETVYAKQNKIRFRVVSEEQLFHNGKRK